MIGNLAFAESARFPRPVSCATLPATEGPAMPKILTPAQCDQYERDGFCGGIDVLDAAEVAHHRAGLETWEHRMGHALDFPEKSKSYLLFDWADAIVHHPRVLDAVEDVIGPDILVFHSTMWIKEANTAAFVLWHQDGAHFHLDPAQHVTAWVALSEASVEAGCMHMIPGSHHGPWLQHEDKPSAHNMIRRGQGLPGYEGRQGTAVPLHAGQLSLHHTKTIHSSGPNNNADRRIGYGISFIPTSVRPVGPAKPSALLVRGQDFHTHFHHETRMAREMTPEAIAAHKLATDRFAAIQNAGFTTVAPAGFSKA